LRQAEINCAGLYSDRVAKMTDKELDVQILPFRGEYFNLKRKKEYLVKI
jgi:L-2-hydroxyglutarate oxidase